MKHQAFRLAGVVATLVLCLASVSLPATAGPEDRLDAIEKRRERIERDLEDTGKKTETLKGTISVLDTEAEDLQSGLDELNAEISELDGRIGEVQAELELAQQRFTSLTEELLGIQDDLVESTDSLTERAIETYKAGPAAYVEGILSSDSFADLSDRYEYYEATVELDSELVTEIERLNEETDARREQVAEEKERIAEAKLVLEKDRSDLAAVQVEKEALLGVQNSLIAEKEDVLRGQLAKKSELEEVVQQLDQDSQEIENLLAQAAKEAAEEAAAPGGGGGGPAPAPPAPAPTNTGGQFTWPASGPVTSPYGYRTHPIFGDARLHTGIDIGAGYGSPVYAATEGTVVFAGSMSGYGNAIVVDHGGGVATTYNHLSGFSTSQGATVGRGQTIGSVGCTGYCTGPHLHFEVRIGGSPVDPMPYLQ
ncbi:MAG: peptidoglycan DD-metalloendopeptidase family protein [Actinomycetota bacterium]|nr:peptidoglycan DD-metalloendopeptidase family protein [Actinomycetota bacterium]